MLAGSAERKMLIPLTARPHLARTGPRLIRPASNDTTRLQPDETQEGRCLNWSHSPPRHPHPDLLQTDTCNACFKTLTQTSPRAILPAVGRS